MIVSKGPLDLQLAERHRGSRGAVAGIFVFPRIGQGVARCRGPISWIEVEMRLGAASGGG